MIIKEKEKKQEGIEAQYCEPGKIYKGKFSYFIKPRDPLIKPKDTPFTDSDKQIYLIEIDTGSASLNPNQVVYEVSPDTEVILSNN